MDAAGVDSLLQAVLSGVLALTCFVVIARDRRKTDPMAASALAFSVCCTARGVDANTSFGVFSFRTVSLLKTAAIASACVSGTQLALRFVKTLHCTLQKPLPFYAKALLWAGYLASMVLYVPFGGIVAAAVLQDRKYILIHTCGLLVIVATIGIPLLVCMVLLRLDVRYSVGSERGKRLLTAQLCFMATILSSMFAFHVLNVMNMRHDTSPLPSSQDLRAWNKTSVQVYINVAFEVYCVWIANNVGMHNKARKYTPPKPQDQSSVDRESRSLFRIFSRSRAITPTHTNSDPPGRAVPTCLEAPLSL